MIDEIKMMCCQEMKLISSALAKRKTHELLIYISLITYIECILMRELFTLSQIQLVSCMIHYDPGDTYCEMKISGRYWL